MIIDDEYCQYEMWRIVNKAETDAIARFNEELKEAECAADPQAAKADFRKKWKDEAEKEEAAAQSTEESVYNVNYTSKLKALWDGEL